MEPDQLERALQDIAAGQSIRETARQYHISKDYLRRRLNGVDTRKEVNETRQSLSKSQEQQLVDWVLLQARLGWAPPHSRFRLFAQRIYIQSGGQNRLGKHWHVAFFRRHPEVKSIRSTGIDFLRVNGASRSNIDEFFDRLDHEELSKVLLEDTYNVDEIGTMIGLGDNPMVIGPAAVRKIVTMDPGNREWVTIIECISAAGRVLPPLVIFKGADVQQQWFQQQIDQEDFFDWLFTASPKGWTNNSIALRWLKEIFIPQTAPADPMNWRHLILDGHGSHVDEPFMLACLEAKIWLDFLPTHTSQVLQPLDLGSFSVLKRAYRKRLREACASSLTMNPKKPEFLEAWNLARKDAFTAANIAAGWIATGIFPRDRSKPLNSRLARQLDQDLPQRPSTPEPRPQGLNTLAALSLVTFQTPRTSRQLVNITRDMRNLEPAFNQATFRHLTRKLCKALDDSCMRIAALTHERDQLAAALERQKPQKRRKVKPTAQERFVAIEDVRRVKAEMGILFDELEGDTDEDDWEDHRNWEQEQDSEVEECILVS